MLREYLLPEHQSYHDEGCELAPSCLSCPLPSCVEDIPRGRQSYIKELRDREMLRLFSQGGLKVAEVSRRFRVSQRTVQRVLSRHRREKRFPGEGGRLN